MKLFFVPGLILLTLCSILVGTVSADIHINSSYDTGDSIVIGGTTNFNTDNSVLIEIWPASFGPKGKYEPSMNGGGSVVVPVQGGDNLNYHWSSTFDSAGWAADTYMVRAEVIGKDYVETIIFDLVEKSVIKPATQVPTLVQSDNNQTENTPVVTQVIPEEIPTEQIPDITPVQTQKSPLSGTTSVLSLCIVIGTLVMLASRR